MNEPFDLKTAVEYGRMLREHILADKDRPGYHFVIPEDTALPGDPNAAFYANGRYHLMYLYHCVSDGCRYGHMSSTDLVHWHSHPDALIPDDLDGGIYSGGAFVDDDGTVWISYRGLGCEANGGKDGIRLAYSRDVENDYSTWTKCEDYAIPAEEYGMSHITLADGSVYHLGVSDPSNIWKDGDYYYMQSGAYHVLHRYGVDKGDDPAYKGDFTELFRSRDLKTWEYLHRFCQRVPGIGDTQDDEDHMCPSFFPLPTSPNGGAPSDTFLELFISHNHGCQYYIGDYDRENQVFVPKRHGRMSVVDNSYFAPEALMAPDGRQILWSWLLDNRPYELRDYGWTGVYGLPRSLWLREDGSLGIEPIEELKTLRYNERSFTDGMRSQSCEIQLTCQTNGASRVGFKVKAAADDSEYTLVYYDSQASELVFDATHSSVSRQFGRCVVERLPLTLAEGEPLSLRLFLDKPVVELFANGKQAITRRVYTDSDDSRHISLITEPCVTISKLTVWDMMPSNMY